MTTLPLDTTFTVGKSSSLSVEELRHTTETPGGFRECSFSLSSKDGSSVLLDDRVTIYNSTYSKYPFIGRISRVHRTGLCYEFTAVRSTRLRVLKSTTGLMTPSHPSGVYAGRIYKAGSPMLQTLTDALQLCEDVFSGSIVAIGDQYITDSVNMGGYTPEQMWNYVASLLSQLDTPLLWHIRGGPGNLQLLYIDYQDKAARYRVKLPEDQIDETYDAEQIITSAAVEYGNDQVYINSLDSVFNAGRMLIHDKYINGSNDVAVLQQAQALVGAHLARFGRFRSSSSTLTIRQGDQVRVVPPLVTAPVDTWPLSLVESGHGIFLVDRPTSHAPYNEGLKFIVGTSYDWDSCELSVTCGDSIGGLENQVNLIRDYNVNRLFNGPYNGPPGGSHPLADADLLNKVGPEVLGTGGLPPSTSYAIPGFKDGIAADGTDPLVKYGKQVDPDIIADEGLEANINFDPSTLGFQAAIRVIPGTFNQYRILLGDTNGLVADTVVAKLYRVIPITENPLGGTQFLTEVSSGGLKDRTAVINPPIVLKRGDYYMIEVTTIGASATWAALSLHAKKNFPALRS